jgi:DNA-directed RNA polymerase sigma subunit (sigma70/sigma32)
MPRRPARIPTPNRDEVTETEIAELPDARRQRVLRKRREGLTLRAIGEEIGCGLEWVRQLERSSLYLIREGREKFEDG